MVFGLLLVLVGLALSWFITAAMGGFQFGSFLRRVEFTLEPAKLTEFYNRFYQRASELGFVPTGNAGEFVQGELDMRDAGAFTHAKTPKILNITQSAGDHPPIKVQLALRYSNAIVADTGESSYRDAVLAYLSGQTDAMTVVPNRSFMAVCTLVGGIQTWLLAGAFLLLRTHFFFEQVIIFGCTFCAVGLIAVVSIALKRGQATGMFWGVSGLLASASAVAVTVILKLVAMV